MGTLMNAKWFVVLSAVIIEWQVVNLLITVFRCMLNRPSDDVLNDNIWTRLPTFIIFGSVVLSRWLYVLAIVVLQLTVVAICVVIAQL